MADLPLGKSDWFRSVAKEARIQLRNRYYEANPVLNTQQIALLARMGLHRFLYVGDGPIRGVYSQPGSFDDAAFVASGQSYFRVDRDKTVTPIGGSIFATALTNPVSAAATGNLGSVPEYLFFCDGRNLFIYIANGYARGTISGTPANNDTVRVDLMYYKFTNASVDAGAPAGTLANPWLVALGANATEAWENLAAAFDNSGIGGTQYSTALAANAVISVESHSSTTVIVRAADAGVVGNAVITTETGAAIAWGAGTLTGGGAASVSQVQTPDDVGIVSVGYIGSFVICVPAQGQGINGRFYWIEPGETVIDPLNYATAERSPDPAFAVVVIGDQFWLPGADTMEVWYMTGDADAPVLRLQGVTFDRGTWEGTAIKVKGAMVCTDSDGAVWKVEGGLQRLTEGRPDIEERIREAIQYQESQTLV